MHMPAMDRRRLLSMAAKLGAGVTVLGGASTVLAACGDGDDSSGDAEASGTGDGTGSAPTASGGTASRTSGELREVSFQTSWIPSVEFGGTYLAIERGYFAEEGLDLVALPGGPNSSAGPIVDAGTALVGISGSDYVARSNTEGASFKVIGAGFQKNPFAVLSLADNPVTEPRASTGSPWACRRPTRRCTQRW